MKNKFGRLAIIALALSLCAIVYAQQQRTVIVSWTAGVCGTTPGCDAATGYIVFRSTNPTTGFTQLNQTPVLGTSYTDATVVDGVTYYYYVEAVDALGDASLPSNTSTGLFVPGNPPPPTGCNAVLQAGNAAVRKVLPVPAKKP